MEEFALIMRHQDGTKVASPEQIQQWMKQTMDWIGGIAAQNICRGTGLPFDNSRWSQLKMEAVVKQRTFWHIKNHRWNYRKKTNSVEEAVELLKAARYERRRQPWKSENCRE
jgi:hypothetical protein